MTVPVRVRSMFWPESVHVWPISVRFGPISGTCWSVGVRFRSMFGPFRSMFVPFGSVRFGPFRPISVNVLVCVWAASTVRVRFRSTYVHFVQARKSPTAHQRSRNKVRPHIQTQRIYLVHGTVACNRRHVGRSRVATDSTQRPPPRLRSPDCCATAASWNLRSARLPAAPSDKCCWWRQRACSFRRERR